MGTVLLWILGILLGIVLLALVIVLVLLNIRAGIEAVGVTGEVSVAASPVSRCRRTDWMSVRSQARCAISSAT